MKIIINKLSLQNFKCFRSKEITFDPVITTIRGRNGEGKTTIADAILFCLFGKNVAGQSDLELFKTRENGAIIPNIDHSVELTLNVSDETEREVTLKRSIKEVWVKKRGSEESVFKNNTVEYYVNGESYTKGDYEKYISSLIDEKVFRAITNPSFFTSLKWQEQRGFLTNLVGKVEVSNKAEFTDLIKQLEGNGEDIEAYLKHLSYQIKQIKEKLKNIPVRLEEQNKAMPEKLDWSALEQRYAELQERLKEVEDKITSIQQGGAVDVERDRIRRQINEVYDKMNAIMDAARTEEQAARNAQQTNIAKASLKFSEALNNQKLMEQTIEADKRLIERCKETIEDCAKTRKKLLAQWPKGTFSFDPDCAICPTCGQPLPEDQLHDKMQKMREDFNAALEETRREINEKGAKNNEVKAKAEEELKNLEEKLTSDTKALADIKEQINVAFAEKAEIEKTVITTAEQICEKNPEYIALKKQTDELQKKLTEVADAKNDTEVLSDLVISKDNLVAECNSTTAKIATKAQYDKIVGLIEGINQEEKDLVAQLSELERKEDVAREYQFQQNQMLEDEINKHFRLVKWKLFKTVNNGGDSFQEPYCECYVNGIAYNGGLNQAARLNAGLDIINTLCRFYNVSAPIALDNAESTINIFETAGQQVRLLVFDSDLTIM